MVILYSLKKKVAKLVLKNIYLIKKINIIIEEEKIKNFLFFIWKLYDKLFIKEIFLIQNFRC